MPKIKSITARQILDSRGLPTVEATVQLDNDVTGTSSVPSGAIVQKTEAVELRDRDRPEYFGRGVMKAVDNVNSIIGPALTGMDPLYQTQIDQTLVNLDGTPNKSKLGANAILAVSQAVMKAAAASLRIPVFVYVKEKYQLVTHYHVPTPIFNLINGGRHGSGTLDFQEFQLVPASHLPYSQALRIGVEMFLAIDAVLEQKGAIRTVGLEGGYSPNLATNTDALEIFFEAIRQTPYNLAKDAFLGIDISPQNFYKGGKYVIRDKNQPLSVKELIQFYQDLHSQYRIFAFEDPLLPEAWNDWKTLTEEMGDTAMIVADDLIATNKTLLMQAIQEKACNSVVIKPNRVGTVTEAIEVEHLAKEAGWHTIMSHRSGETNDDFMADLAVGIGTDYVKFGAPSRGERVEKYNRLLRVEEILLKTGQTDSSVPAPTAFTPQLAAPEAMPAESTSAPAAESLPELETATSLQPTESRAEEAPSMPEPPLVGQRAEIAEVPDISVTAVTPSPSAEPELFSSAPLVSTLQPSTTIDTTQVNELAQAVELEPEATSDAHSIQSDLNELVQMVEPASSTPVTPVSPREETSVNTPNSSGLRPPTPPQLP